MILQNLKEFVEKFVNDKIKKEVITVPAYFNNFQRQKTKEASESAGLKVIKIINEDIAAAIAYADQIDAKNWIKVLIFDIGGGTFDTSILKIKKNEYIVLASCWDSNLGRKNFDNKIIEHSKDLIKKNPTFKELDFNNEDESTRKAKTKLKVSAENIKIELSKCIKERINDDVKFYEDALFKGKDFTFEINRGKFEEWL